MATAMRRLWILAAALAAATPACGRGPLEVRSVAPEQAAASMGETSGPVLLDVRSEAEYRAGRVPGALHVPHDQVAAHLGELAPYRARGVIAYCESGKRAAIALDALARAGFRNLGHLEGDMDHWRKEGRPVETGAP